MKRTLFCLLLLTISVQSAFSQKTIAQDQRMQWWREARFGMFIHWGLYCIPAGEWKGTEYPQIGEWIMKNARIPVLEYRGLARQFNPVKFNAKDFVATAKNAGMKYITITSKHHDGFAMFKSNASKYNIVDATPYGKDVIKALAEECQKQGLKLCFYYSQSRDWNEPNGLDNEWDFPKERNFQYYLDAKVKPQLTELLLNYGPIGLIWFDTPMTISKEQAQSLKELVRSLQPECIISGRLGGGVETDYMSTGDNVIPATVVPGDWMKINSDAIYGTQAGPYKIEFNWGNITQKQGKLYLGIFNWPTADFYLEGLKNKVKKIYLLADKQQKALPYKEIFDPKADHHRLKIQLPKQAPDQIVSVVVVEIEGAAEVETAICQQANKTILLPGILATAQKEGKPANLKFTARGGGADWLDAAINLTWRFKVEKAGTYQVDMVTTETGSHGTPVWEGGQTIKIRCAGQELSSTVADESREYNQRSQYWKLIHSGAGKIKFDKPGTYELTLIPQIFTEKKIGFTFKEINLKPVK